MPTTETNPFQQPREARAHVVTVRLTPTEYQAVLATAGNIKGAHAALIREGLGLAIEARRKAKAKR
jgi:hypothetical protein